MMNSLDALLSFNQEALNLRAYRSQVLASNIANSDTPGYQARDFDFSKALQQAMDNAGTAGPLAASAERHVQPAGPDAAPGGVTLQYRTVTQASVDNNTVDLDVERARFADNAVHFEANLMFVSSQIKTMLAAIQG